MTDISTILRKKFDGLLRRLTDIFQNVDVVSPEEKQGRVYPSMTQEGLITLCTN